MKAILVVNAGSSSLKFQLFENEPGPRVKRLLKGQLDGIGVRPRLRATKGDGAIAIDRMFSLEEVRDLPAAIQVTAEWLRGTENVDLAAIGHRVVHGGPEYSEPILVSPEVLDRLARYIPLAPLHQPNNLAPIRTILELRPELPQVACFDTAFHRGHGPLADHFAIPEELYAEGVRRYGFHGLSYEYIADRLPQVAPELAHGRVIVAHLGSGASMCALAAGAASRVRWASRRSTASPWGRGPVRSIPVSCCIYSRKRVWTPPRSSASSTASAA